jgi:beta-xylosidase
MKYCFTIYLLLSLSNISFSQTASNPILFADVPDISIIRVGKTYYMSSTTMHMSPGLPIMKSTDLVNWKTIGYAYDTLASTDALNLQNNKNAYGSGSWASSLRYYKGTYYVSTFSSTTGKTYIYRTNNIEKKNWQVVSFTPAYHDHSLHFDDDGKAYLIYGAGKLKILQLNNNLDGVVPNSERTLIENASIPSGTGPGLKAEGSQLFKINGMYYLYNITWPQGGMRTVVLHRAKSLYGPWEGKVALQDSGIAQGGLISTYYNKWFSYLFRDYGAVGRIPYLVPTTWANGWPVIGDNGKVPTYINLKPNKSLIPGIVTSDDFLRKKREPTLPLAWQWNHNPDNALWTLDERKGFLRLKTGRIDSTFLTARNTITQRTIGPQCTASISLDVSYLKDGDFAGIALLQKNFGQVGVKMNNNTKQIVMVNASNGSASETAAISLNSNIIYLKAVCNFINKTDVATFFYSVDNLNWLPIGTPLKMSYTLPHFMGYRFGLFCYATKNIGGFADFDFYKISY